MQAPPELPGVCVAPPVSMQAQIVMQKQQNCVNASSSRTLVVPTSSVIRSIPVSLSVSRSGSDSKSTHSSVSTNSNMSQELIIVKSPTGTADNQESQTKQPKTANEDVYRLSEVVLKEKDSLFKLGDSESIYMLEPPREGVQTVRMRSKNFFTVIEESDEDTDGKNTPKLGQEKQLTPNFPMYTPVFSFGQSLHTIFHQAGKHKRLNKAVVKSSAQEENTQDDDQQHVPTHSSEYESDPENFGHWYGKISMTTGMRRNRSQPDLEKTSLDELIEHQEGKTFSQSLPATPGGSPKLQRRNSFTNLSMESLKPQVLNPESTGPGLSFLASVAGELRSYKKRYNANSNPKLDTQVVEYKSDHLAIERHRSASGEIQKRPGSGTSIDSSPDTSPLRPSSMAEMKANALNNAGQEKKSLFKSVIDWGTTTQIVGKKEANMYSPCSF